MSDWSQGKQIKVYFFLTMILVLTASFLTFDWTQYYFGIVRSSDPEWLYSRLTKTATSLVVFLLAFSIGGDEMDPSDHRRLRRCFLAIFAGDLLFLLDEISPLFDLFAVLAFLTGHILVIVRNAQGLLPYFRRKLPASSFLLAVLSATAILFLTGILYIFTLFNQVRGSPFQYVFPVYALVLDLSLWAGWMTLQSGYFPKPNAVLIALGATFFFVGDYLVGFNLTLAPSLQRTTTLFMTWIFYAPAITLLALSGYRWKLQSFLSRMDYS